MSTHVEVDSCSIDNSRYPYRYRLMSIFANVEACRFDFDSDHCRLLSMSVLINVDSCRCQFWPITAHVDDGSSRCRQLLLSTLSVWSSAVNPVDSRNLLWSKVRAYCLRFLALDVNYTNSVPFYWPRGNYNLGPSYTTILLFWCIFNIQCNINHIIMAACFVVASFKHFGCVWQPSNSRLLDGDRSMSWVWINSSIVHSYVV